MTTLRPSLMASLRQLHASSVEAHRLGEESIYSLIQEAVLKLAIAVDLLDAQPQQEAVQ